MKRHESLAPLSREHHDALILAQLMKKNAPNYNGLPTDNAGKVMYAMNLFNTTLKEHFFREELMLRKVEHCHEDIRIIGQEILQEHEQLTAFFLNLDNAANQEDIMDQLGISLDQHIRKEERILFPLIQQYCSEELLQEVSGLLQ